MNELDPKRIRTHIQAITFGLVCTLIVLAAAGRPDSIESTPATHSMPRSSGIESGQDFVSNGGFENDSASWTWVDSVALTMATVHSGQSAFEAADADSTRYSFVWQPLAFAYDSTKVTFWVYPASQTYYQFFELIANWQPGPAVLITRVTLRDDRINFTAVDSVVTIDNVLTPNAWNEITIEANSATLVQDFYVNDSLYSSIPSAEFPVIEHLLVGDLSVTGNYGTLYYDDISITGSVETPVPIAVDDQFVDNGGEPKFFPIVDNDVVPPGTTIQIAIDTPPQHGQILSIESNGIWFQKDEGFEGKDQLSYSLEIAGQAGSGKTHASEGPGVLYVTAFACACGLLDEEDGCFKNSPSRLDAIGKLLQAGMTLASDSLDEELLRRWRDELLRTTDGGDALFDDLTFHSPELLQLVLFDRPELLQQALNMFNVLQAPARSMLEGDGKEMITMAQMDSVAAMFEALESGAGRNLRRALRTHLEVIGPLDKYVGLSAHDAYDALVASTQTAVRDEAPSSSTGIVLGPSFPNPFVDKTQIGYELRDATRVSLEVFDIQGRRVRSLAMDLLQQGAQTIVWDRLDDGGERAASGVYFVRLRAGLFQTSRTLVVVD